MCVHKMEIRQSPLSLQSVNHNSADVHDITVNTTAANVVKERSRPVRRKSASNTTDSNSTTGSSMSSSGRPLRRSSHPSHKGSVSSNTGKRVFVEHKYHDHYHNPIIPSLSPEAAASSSALLSASTKTPPSGNVVRGGVTLAFPERLHEMLTAMHEEGLQDIISWQPHGRCFLIHKKKEFVEDVMPRFFHQTKLTSFQRQLNLYGFVRLTAGQDRGAYYHELFLRGRIDLTRHMVRTRVKGNGMKAASSPETEPNFYVMEHCTEDGPRGPWSPTFKVSETEHEEDEEEDEESFVQDGDKSAETQSSMDMKGDIDMPVVEDCDKLHTSLPIKSYSMMPISRAALISPPHSPLAAPTSFLCTSMAASKATEKGPGGILDILDAAFSETELLSPLPNTGDAVFFEGLKFRYLDHLDMDMVADDCFAPTNLCSL